MDRVEGRGGVANKSPEQKRKFESPIGLPPVTFSGFPERGKRDMGMKEKVYR